MTTREGRRVRAGGRASGGPYAPVAEGRAGGRPGGEVAGLLRRFPPRPAHDGWPAPAQRRGYVLARLLAPPFSDGPQSGRRAGLTKLLHWLEDQPGASWQERWAASGADAAGNLAWRELAASWLRETGQASRGRGDAVRISPRRDCVHLFAEDGSAIQHGAVAALRRS